MKLIEAMKQIKELQEKAEDLRKKVGEHCAIRSFETPTYGDRQGQQIQEWIQAHSDILKKVLELHLAVQKTNLQTAVSIKLGDVEVTKSIAAWIHRRRNLAESERAMWARLTDKNIKEGEILPSSVPGQPGEKVKIVRYFDPTVRDTKIELYRTEPGIIDRTLEVTNAVTDIIE